MRPLSAEPNERAPETPTIGRIPLRRLPAHGPGDALRLGSEFTGHRTHPDGLVRVLRTVRATLSSGDGS